MSIPIIRKLRQRIAVTLTHKQREWAWFIGLWFGGLLSVGTLAYLIRLLMGID